jgi:RNA polymerase sigma-70 factor (ECF subfamily)
MHEPDKSDFSDLLDRARAGDPEVRQELLERFRNYLTLLASMRTNPKLQAKFDQSDLVQETMIQANHKFSKFRGTSEPELAGWLRAILGKKQSLLARHYLGTAGRDPRLERQLQAGLDQSSMQLAQALVAGDTSPSLGAARREQAVLLADALAQLPDHYRDVVVLHHVEGHTMREVAQAMDRTVESVKKLWARAMVQLRKQLRED